MILPCLSLHIILILAFQTEILTSTLPHIIKHSLHLPHLSPSITNPVFYSDKTFTLYQRQQINKHKTSKEVKAKDCPQNVFGNTQTTTPSFTQNTNKIFYHKRRETLHNENKPRRYWGTEGAGRNAHEAFSIPHQQSW